MTDGNTLVTIPLVQKIHEPDERVRDLYFAYGSNMNLRQIGSRCSRPLPEGVARLADHRLSFYGHSEIWDGALETVEPSPGDEVWGVMFSLGRLDWERLDDWQGARMDGGGMYFHFPAMVTGIDGQQYSVRFYRMDVQGSPRNPSREYLEHIARGASENGLSPSYIGALMQREAYRASYTVPMRATTDLAKFAGISCADCPSGAA